MTPEPSSSSPVLQLRGLTKSFGGIVAVDDVTLDVAAGQVHGVIGPNGAGKTTLFDMIAGIQAPSAGRILYDTVDIGTWSSVRRARAGIRRTFQRQQPIGLLSVEDNVLAALDWHGGSGGSLADLLGLPGRRRVDAARREEVADVLRRCGLADEGDTKAGALPIGAARLLEFARAIVDAPRVVLLDEPTSGLSEVESGRIELAIGELRDTGCAVLLVEHDVGFVMRCSDHVTAMDLGSVIAAGTPEQIRANDLVRDAYLG